MQLGRKNSIARLMKTNCRALLAFNVPKNIIRVKSPHMNRYAAIPALSGAKAGVSVGSRIRKTSDIQNKPYDVNARVPKVLPLRNSITPAII